MQTGWIQPMPPQSTRLLTVRSGGAVGVFVALSADTRVAHNAIHEMPYTSVSIGYRWNTTPTSQVRCVAEYNQIYEFKQKEIRHGSNTTR